jgi:hypothetical protein
MGQGRLGQGAPPAVCASPDRHGTLERADREAQPPCKKVAGLGNGQKLALRFHSCPVPMPHFFLSARQALSQRGQTEGAQASIENVPVDPNALGQQFPVAPPQIRHEGALEAHFKDSDAAHDSQAARLRPMPGGPLVDDGKVSRERSRQQHRGQLSSPQGMQRAQSPHLGGRKRGMALDPTRVPNGLGGGSSSATHNHLVAHFVGDVDVPEKLAKQVQLADPREGDERGGIGYDDHSLIRGESVRTVVLDRPASAIPLSLARDAPCTGPRLAHSWACGSIGLAIASFVGEGSRLSRAKVLRSAAKSSAA